MKREGESHNNKEESRFHITLGKRLSFACEWSRSRGNTLISAMEKECCPVVDRELGG